MTPKPPPKPLCLLPLPHSPVNQLPLGAGQGHLSIRATWPVSPCPTRPPGCPHPHPLLMPGSGARTLVPSTQVHEHFTRRLMGSADRTPPGSAAHPSQYSDHSLAVLLAPSHPPTCIPSVGKPCGSSCQNNSTGQSHSPSLRLRARPGTVSTQKRALAAPPSLRDKPHPRVCTAAALPRGWEQWELRRVLGGEWKLGCSQAAAPRPLSADW